ncbi:MAG: tRNA (adenosine(37)-N6)-threonylcarbamoyltransferase complex transferase subunit TsaD [Candidatus Pacebacteria bacterium]|nr:tRNA (adenosine(37)-N6)-threonylcarbamoyltransferase complex transferase subunit TsaD [Candidatus Paceibacterota bacterium]
MKPKIILAIETSCDDTSIAAVKCSGSLTNPKFEVLKNIVSSQIKIHRPFGGVVPNLAKREHIKNLPKILKLISKDFDVKKIDYIAVTVGPGLEPALWTGISFAQELAAKLKKPLVGVNHMEGHLYSNWLAPAKNFKNLFPAISIVVSGGHTMLLLMQSAVKWKKLGETIDDAAGEAFDKVARMLELPYPGGPEIEKAALRGNSVAVKFPRPLLSSPKNPQKNYDFSFSGLKTSVLYYIRDHFNEKDLRNFKDDIAASFQQAVIDVLTQKTLSAAKQFKTKSVMLSGGVSANKTLREIMRHAVEQSGKKFFAPSFEFNTDNAAMIAAAAYFDLLQKKPSLKFEADSNLTI